LVIQGPDTGGRKMNEQDLINFEKDIAENYEEAKIRGSVHLSGGNEKQLIQIFENIRDNDWVFSTHRSHYHALLKSKDPKWLKEQIFLKRSSHINSRKYKIFTSAIVGGICPIALGVALAIKRKRRNGKVWCFVGDMSSEMGIFHECLKYARGENLPITFIIEDNGLGCYTPTSKVWKERTNYYCDLKNVNGYEYRRIYPHYGIGKWINF
jgi:pyruvate dehydrogenase E1 component alpha subunit